ncbi:DUF2157 domain-containing protein [Nocardioides yefusunii]|uniref:DUF2157 domain-containing protein n=1 Tax=Nocardioides yefusunii TaxID=2500546 RepID=A0ABW1R0X0_9ACTN|nr:DUF2157 domain-containing protein [Nocardioides yefusunii]
MTMPPTGSTVSSASPDAAPPGLPAPVRTAPRDRLVWLREESLAWQAEGLVTSAQMEVVLARYSPSRGFSLGRLLLGLGAAFFGVGLIWLVASNLEDLSPGLRFGVVTALWLFFLLGSEVLHQRGTSRVVVGAGRTLAAFAIGAVVFQAAQSLQVPAYEPSLLGAWGAAALLHAYVTRARGPLLVGLAGTAAWSVWQGVAAESTFGDFIWTFGLTGTAMVALAAVHRGGWSDFARPWRTVGAALALVALFIGCLPMSEGLELSWGTWNVTLLVISVGAVGSGLWRGDRLDAVETLVVAASATIALLMAAWIAADDTSRIGAGDVAHAAVGVLVYVALAIALAVSGTLRDSSALTTLATAGLVVFTTFQSFAVFGEIITGAWLFVALGIVLLGTGFGFDRTRRRLATELADELTTPLATPLATGSKA